MSPAPITSRNAITGELCGDKPAVAIANIAPSKLQGTINFPDLMPSRAFFATSLAFIPPDEAAMIFVNSGLLFCSENRVQTKEQVQHPVTKSAEGVCRT